MFKPRLDRDPVLRRLAVGILGAPQGQETSVQTLRAKADELEDPRRRFHGSPAEPAAITREEHALSKRATARARTKVEDAAKEVTEAAEAASA